MSEHPYFQTLRRWNELKATIAHLQAEEKTLREGLFQGSFPTPSEGTNTLELPDGSVLKGTYKLNRKIVESAYKDGWTKIAQQLPSATAMKLIRTKHELSVTDYKKLPVEQQKLVDTVLEIKPGLPSLELVPPKED